MAAQQFATLADLAQLGLPQAVLDAADEKTPGTTARNHEASNARAQSALEEHGTAPFTAWGADVVANVCAHAAFPIARVLGFNPDNPSDMALVMGWKAAEQWFQDVAAGRVTPSGLVDSTPDVQEGGFYVSTRPSRGWVR